jgi:prepilin peptidase CpaA
MGVAMVYHTGINGVKGLSFSIEGVGLGIALLIVFYLMGGMGGGDVKLMGAIGGLLGPEGVFMAFLFSAIIGGLFAIFLLAFHGYLKERVKIYGTTLMTIILTRTFSSIHLSNIKNRPKLCYGVVIALGTLSSVFMGIGGV